MSLTVTFARLNKKQVQHLEAVIDWHLQEWYDGRVLAALSRKNLIAYSQLSERYIPRWGVEEAWQKWKGEKENGRDDSVVSGSVGVCHHRPQLAEVGRME